MERGNRWAGRVNLSAECGAVPARAIDRDLQEEMRLHLELRQQEHLDRSLPAEDAHRAARRNFGNATLLLRSERRGLGLELARSVCAGPAVWHARHGTYARIYGCRGACAGAGHRRQHRHLQCGECGPAAAAGIQGLRRLVTILHSGSDPVAAANYIDWRDQSRSFEAMGAAEYWSPNLTGSDPPEHLTGLRVTQSLMPMLGVEPLLGRLFIGGEDQKGAEHEVVLSYRLWQRRFAGDRNVLGKSVTFDGEGYTVIGVMPREFKFAPFWATHAELWVPLAFGDRMHNRGGNSLRIFARLKPGVRLKEARAEIATITSRLERQYPGTNRDVVVTPLKENVVGKIETPLLVLLGAVGFVLLIACANVAHMLLARAAARQREIAVRAALGARRGRMVRQFLTESLLLAAMGAAGGFLLALAGTHALVALSPANIPQVETVTMDARIVLFMLGVTALTSVAFGLAPAMQASVGESDRRAQRGWPRRERRHSPQRAEEFSGGIRVRPGTHAADWRGTDDSQLPGARVDRPWIQPAWACFRWWCRSPDRRKRTRIDARYSIGNCWSVFALCRACRRSAGSITCRWRAISGDGRLPFEGRPEAAPGRVSNGCLPRRYARVFPDDADSRWCGAATSPRVTICARRGW